MISIYDPNPWKSDANLAKHGVGFEAAELFEWDSAIEARDVRRAYTEVRSVAVGFIGERLHVMVFTRRGRLIRIISLRKAHPKEVRRYAEF